MIIDWDEGRNEFTAAFGYNPNIVEQIKQIAGRRFIPGNKAWKLPLTEDALDFTNRNKAELSSSAKVRINQHYAMVEKINGSQDTLKKWRNSEAEIPAEFSTREKIESFRHQRVMTASSLLLDRMAFLVEMGAGKTKAAIEACKTWRNKEGAGIILVACPPEAVYVWLEQIEKYSSEFVPRIIPAGLTPKKRSYLLAEIKNESKKADIIAIANYDSIRVAKEKFKELNPFAVIMDESHLLKTPTSQRTKAMLEIVSGAKYRLILTGTAILNSLEDVFSQFKLIDEGATFGSSSLAFREKYFYDANVELRTKTKIDWPDYRLKQGSTEIIKSKIARLSVQYKKSECLTLPEKLYSTLYVKMEGEQARVYKQMAKEMTAEFGDKIILTQNALTKLGKLRQITSGFCIVHDDLTGKDSTVIFDEQPKIQALMSFFEGIRPEQKMIVWTCFRADCQRIYELFQKKGVNPAIFNGDLSAEDRSRQVKMFQEDPSCRVFVATVQAGGRSISLTAASYAVYYSNSYSLEHRLQSEDRPHRPGLKNPITIVDIVARRTIDSAIIQALQAKKELAETVINSMDLMGENYPF